MFRPASIVFRLLPLLLTLALPGAIAAAQEARSAELYRLMTFPVRIDPSLYTDPFDSGDIELLGVFRSPSGAELVIPGFWMQPYADRCEPSCRVEVFEPDGEPTWQVRFTPDEIGEWEYALQVRDDGTLVQTETGQFTVRDTGRSGFIHISENDRYFQYSNGRTYFPIGHNLRWSWEDGGGVVAYERWLRDLSEAGGNYARLYIDTPWFIGLEWESAGDYRAAQEAAARLDRVLEAAQTYGVALQLVIQWQQALTQYREPPAMIPDTPRRPDLSADWDSYGYNVLNGGPLSGPGVFLYDTTARTLFKRRLQYIAARWGFSPNIFAWELIDEIDRVAGYNPDTAEAWLREMAGYLRQVDQGRHLITAGSREFNEMLLLAVGLDFTQARFYQRLPYETTGDQVTGAVNLLRRNTQIVSVPTLLSAFSLNPWFEPTADDPEGVHVQTTMWASALSGAAGGAMPDWGETYVVPLNLQRYYPALAAFASGVDWANLDLRPAEAALTSDDERFYQPFRIREFNRNYSGQVVEQVTRVVSADGVIPGVSDLPSYLYGRLYNPAWNKPALFQITPPRDTTLEVRVQDVSSQSMAILRVMIDGVNALELELQPNARDVAVRLPLRAGEHIVMFENIGNDWLELDWLEVEHLVTPVRVLSLRDSAAGVALAWLQHRDYTWETAGDPRDEVQFGYRLDAMPPGTYRVEIWNPRSGAVIGEEIVSVAADGVLHVELVPMRDQLALRMFRVPDAEATPEAEITPESADS